ncbi:MAG TPA: MOSC domain-containing protein [Candidatus Nitrosopolaris sp.]|nr:MOSC domain-containing protein [Candidatus Nitrosopolaris sp.]
MESPRIDSGSVGDATRYRTLAALEEGLRALATPRDGGRIARIVVRGTGGRREELDRVRLEVGAGLPGDAWGRRPEPHPGKAIAVMQSDVAELIANGQPLTLFGDNLFLSLDLSTENLPPGSRLRAGGALLEVTPMPHNGCHKFQGRFGPDALRFVANPELRHRNLRGIYLRTAEGGEVAAGDPVAVTLRARSLR